MQAVKHPIIPPPTTITRIAFLPLLAYQGLASKIRSMITPDSYASSSQLEEAYQHCQRIAQQHTENFPTASLLIHKQLRPAVAAIYAFAREADDMADEGDEAAEIRIKKLDAWASLLDRSVHEPLEHPVFLALGDSIRRHHLPIHALHDLLTAFRMDCSITRYTHEDELMFYAKHSANPVGRLILTLHGITDSHALHASDCICTALQLTNFWQDLSVDLPRDRCYVPSNWLENHGLHTDDLLHQAITEEAFAPVLHRLHAFTQHLFLEGFALLPYLPLRLRLQIAASLHGGMAILNATIQQTDLLHQRPHLSRKDWWQLAPRIIQTAMFPQAARQRHTTSSTTATLS